MQVAPAGGGQEVQVESVRYGQELQVCIPLVHDFQLLSSAHRRRRMFFHLSNPMSSLQAANTSVCRPRD